MSTANFIIELIKDRTQLLALIKRLCSVSAFALDIETVNWWNRARERIALVQIAYRVERQVKVAVIDTLAELDLEALRFPLELDATVKVIHNAVFDASRLAHHFGFKVRPYSIRWLPPSAAVKSGIR